MKTYSMRHNEDRDVWIITVRDFGSQVILETKEKSTYGKAKRWIEAHKRKATSDVPVSEPGDNEL